MMAMVMYPMLLVQAISYDVHQIFCGLNFFIFTQD